MESYLRKRSFRLTLLVLVVLGGVTAVYLLRDIFAPLILGFLIAYVLDPVADVLERVRMGPVRFNRTGAVVLIFVVVGLCVGVGVVSGGYYVSEWIYSAYRDVRGEPLCPTRAAAQIASVDYDQDPKQSPETIWWVDLDGGGTWDSRVKFGEEFRSEPYYCSEAAAQRKAQALARELEPASSLTVLSSDSGYYIDYDGDDQRDPGYLARFRVWAASLGKRYHLDDGFNDFVSNLTDEDGGLAPEKLRDSALASVKALQRAESPGKTETTEAPSGPGFFSLISYLLFCPLYAFFFLLEIDPMIAAIRGYLPGRQRPRIERIFAKIDKTLSSFMRGRLIICLIKSGVTAVGLWLLGVDYWFVLGLVAGFLSLVPYVGIYFSLVPALILCWLEYTSWGRVVGVAALYMAVEWAEGFVLVPQILGKEIGLHPLTVIVTLLIFGKVLGFIGLLLSVPLAAICKILGQEFILPLVLEFAREKPVEAEG